MRLRKLGHGQSVLIVAPPEIDRAIRVATQLGFDDEVQVADILRWAMLETCADIRRQTPHWVEQGLAYSTRQYSETMFEQTSEVDYLRNAWLRPEAKTLEQLYGNVHSTSGDAHIRQQVSLHPKMSAHLQSIGITEFGNARLSEEQEREVSHELERERQVQRPAKLKAAVHTLHPHVVSFTETGEIPSGSDQFKPLFGFVQHIGGAWDGRLLATRDFVISVENSAVGNSLHDYMRPVNWVLSRSIGPEMLLVVISPYEANELLPSMRANTSGVHLHIYGPRLAKDTTPLSDFRFYCVPPISPSARQVPTLLRNQLSLWAGQLYFDSYVEYKELCAFLGLYMGYTADEIYQLQAGDHIQTDGFVKRGGFKLVRGGSRFTQSPVAILRELFGLRRKGVDYLSTHMGQVLNARELFESDFV